MATILNLADFRTTERQTEAQVMAVIRRDCLSAGLTPEQTQHALARVRASYRERATCRAMLRSTEQAVVERARSDGLASHSLLAGLQTAFRELLEGRSAATAIQSAYKVMRPAMSTQAPKGAA